MGRPFAHFVVPELSLYTVLTDFLRRLFITLRKELNVLYFFEFLIEFLAKTNDYWLDLLLLRRSSLKWLVTVLKNILYNCYSMMNAEKGIRAQILG